MAFALILDALRTDWLVKSERYVERREAHRTGIRAAMIVICLFAAALLFNFQVSFPKYGLMELSRPSMNALAKQAISSKQQVPDQWAGLLYVRYIRTTPFGVVFRIANYENGTRYVYLIPGQDPPEGAESLGGQWHYWYR